MTITNIKSYINIINSQIQHHEKCYFICNNLYNIAIKLNSNNIEEIFQLREYHSNQIIYNKKRISSFML